MSARDEALAALNERVQRAAAGNIGELFTPDALSEVAYLRKSTDLVADLAAAHKLGAFHWLRQQALPPQDGREDLIAAIRLFEPIYHSVPDAAPPAVQQFFDRDATVEDGKDTDPIAASQRAMGFLGSAQQTGRIDPLIQGVHLLRVAEAAGREHPSHIGFVINLTNFLRMLYQRTADARLLDEAVIRCRTALARSRLDRQTDQQLDQRLRAILLHNYLLVAIDAAGPPANDTPALMEAVEAGRDLFTASSTEAAERAEQLHVLAKALQSLAAKTGGSALLREGVAAAREASALTPLETEPGRTRAVLLCALLNELGQRAANSVALREAVEVTRALLSVTSIDDPAREAAAANLGLSLSQLYDVTDDAAVLHEAEATTRGVTAEPSAALGHTNNQHIRMGVLLRLFESTAQPEHLEEAETLAREVVRTTPADHPMRSTYLSNLARVLRRRFEMTQDLAPLSEAVRYSRDARDCAPTGAARAAILATLGANLSTLYEQTREEALIDESVESRRAAAGVALAMHPWFVDNVVGLVGSLRIRSEATNSSADLEEAVRVGREGLRLIPSDHSQRGRLLWAHHGNLSALFLLTRELDTGWEAAEAGRQYQALEGGDAVTLGTQHRVLAALAEQTGQVTLLVEAVEVARATLSTLADQNTDGGGAQADLALALSNLYLRTRDANLLLEAVDHARLAVAEPVADPPNLPNRLNTLGSCLRALYELTDDIEVLDEGVRAAREAVQRLPVDSPSRPNFLSNLEGVLIRSLTPEPDPAVVEEALSAGERALAAAGPTHERRGWYLSNHAAAIAAVFDHTGDPGRLETAASLLREAMAILPTEHPRRASTAFNLGVTLGALFDATHDPAALQEALENYSFAAAHPAHPVAARVDAYRKVVELAEAPGSSPNVSLAAVQAIARLLPQLTPRYLDPSEREREIRKLAGLPSFAAATAVAAGDARAAVELLEQTRGVLIADAAGARDSDLTQLREKAPELAEEFDRLGILLGRAAPSDDERSTAGPLPRLQAEWDDLLKRIRSREGFARFLGVPDIHSLAEQSHAGPVVMVYASEDRCDALILRPDTENPVTVVKLTALSRDSAFEYIRKYLEALSDAMGQKRPRPPEQAPAQARIHEVLAWLWDTVAEPVLDALGYVTTPRPRSQWPHIWWCPIGVLTYLPIHAAGHHTSSAGRSVLDRAVSSYTVSLRALAHARARQANAAADRTLIVSEPGGGDIPYPYLPGAYGEARALASLIPGARLLEHPTRQDVLAALPDYSNVHFACHGGAGSDPRSGRLFLRDHREAPLTVRHISDLQLANAGLAFLSACETSLTVPDLTDEGVHITSAFQLAGYRHVIGTLWPVEDLTGSQIAIDVMARLTEGGAKPPDPQKAAESLHHVLRETRETYRAAPTVWTTHVHTGA